MVFMVATRDHSERRPRSFPVDCCFKIRSVGSMAAILYGMIMYIPRAELWPFLFYPGCVSDIDAVLAVCE